MLPSLKKDLLNTITWKEEGEVILKSWSPRFGVPFLYHGRKEGSSSVLKWQLQQQELLAVPLPVLLIPTILSLLCSWYTIINCRPRGRNVHSLLLSRLKASLTPKSKNVFVQRFHLEGKVNAVLKVSQQKVGFCQEVGLTITCGRDREGDG